MAEAKCGGTRLVNEQVNFTAQPANRARIFTGWSDGTGPVEKRLK